MPLWHQLMNQKPLFSISENYSQYCQTTLSWSKYYSLVSIGVSSTAIVKNRGLKEKAMFIGY
jgi:hypothetical protein